MPTTEASQKYIYGQLPRVRGYAILSYSLVLIIYWPNLLVISLSWMFLFGCRQIKCITNLYNTEVVLEQGFKKSLCHL